MNAVAKGRTIDCERCGATLTCMAGTGAPCWCGKESFRLPMPLPAGVGPFADCLCPDCLRAVATDLARRPEFADRRAELEKAAAAKLAAAQALGEQLAGKTVRIAQKAGVDGRLFGSVTNADIAEALSQQGLAVQKSQVRLPGGPLKTVGEHPVSVAPHGDVVVELTVQVVAAAD